MIDISKSPQPELSVNFEIPKVKLLKTGNVPDIYYVKKEKLPIVQLILYSSAGSKFDPQDRKGLCFLTSLLIDEGAGRFDALQLNNEFEKLGTVLNISVDHDTFSFSLLSLQENFKYSLELLSKIINEPRFEEKDFAREKKKVLDRILQLKEEPSYIASYVFDKLIFKDSYYAFPEIGFEDSVARISNSDIKKFFNDAFRSSNKSLIIVGSVNEDEIIELVEKYLPDRLQHQADRFVQPVKEKTKFYLVDKKDSAQTEIRIGHLTNKRNEKDFYSTRIMNTILGGQFSSRINLNLREKKGFTYGAGSSFNYLVNSGYFNVSTSVNIKNTGEAVAEIIKELEEIKKNISDEEIEFAKSNLIKQFPSKFETYSQIANNISPIILHSLPLNYYENYTNRLDLTTKEEIINSAKESINTDKLIVVCVGDKKIIEPQLKMFAGNDITELDLLGNPVK